MKSLLQLISEVDVRELLTLVRARLARWIAPKRHDPIVVGLERNCGQRPLEIPPANVEQLDNARGYMLATPIWAVKICRGPKKGCDGGEQQHCVDCYAVHWHDKRPSAEILQAMERGDA